MRATGSIGLIAIGLAVGMAAAVFYLGQPRPAVAVKGVQWFRWVCIKVFPIQRLQSFRSWIGRK